MVTAEAAEVKRGDTKSSGARKAKAKAKAKAEATASNEGQVEAHEGFKPFGGRRRPLTEPFTWRWDAMADAFKQTLICM